MARRAPKLDNNKPSGVAPNVPHYNYIIFTLTYFIGELDIPSIGVFGISLLYFYFSPASGPLNTTC